MLKGTKLYSIVFNKCPRCHEGNFFTDNNPYHFKTLGDMPHNCAVCNENYEREVGFYYGAMYASYGVDLIIGGTMFLIMVVTLGMGVWEFLFTFCGVIIVLFPWIFRTSRLIWINLFVKYNKKFSEKQYQ